MRKSRVFHAIVNCCDAAPLQREAGEQAVRVPPTGVGIYAYGFARSRLRWVEPGLAEAGKLAEFTADELSDWVNPTSNSFGGKIYQLATNSQTIPMVYY
ncbi:MAG TPA: hypothetical protein VGV07_07850, partial [Devosia sp.]|uniref:hypothetical protein n=1 Tax=Devosia sp. TaxID=1871048 RepID=UPI002DDD9939